MTEEIRQLEERRAMLKSELHQIEERIQEAETIERHKNQTPLTAESLIQHAESEVLLNPVVKRGVFEDGEHKTVDVANTPAMVLQGYLMNMHGLSYLGYDKGELVETILDFILDGVEKPVSTMTAEEAISEIQEMLDDAYEIFTVEEFVEEFSEDN